MEELSLLWFLCIYPTIQCFYRIKILHLYEFDSSVAVTLWYHGTKNCACFLHHPSILTADPPKLPMWKPNTQRDGGRRW